MNNGNETTANVGKNVEDNNVKSQGSLAGDVSQIMFTQFAV